MGRVVAIWIKRAHRAPMDSRSKAHAVPGKGLVGCANNSRTRQITLIESEVWSKLMRQVSSKAPPSARRANLMLSGLPLENSRNRLLRVGSALLRITGETKPCEVMEAVAPGLQKAMSLNWGGGAFAQVLEEGDIAVGDKAKWAGRVVPKALAYITRQNRAGKEVLVFRHKHNRSAGIQVPAGTIEAGEKPEDALHREVFEETGLTDLKLVGRVSIALFYADWRRQWQERHFFHLEAQTRLPDKWAHVVRSDAGDNGLHFSFFWMPIDEAANVLHRGHGACLESL